MDYTTQQRGQIAQLKVEQRALELGLIVSKPTVDARYDLVLDDGKSLMRVQVKYIGTKSKSSDGSVMVDFRKRHKNRTLFYDKSEVDVILAYIPAVDKIVRLGPEHFQGRSAIIIRISPTLNNQSSKVNDLSDFLW